jgi:polar amino acid transport system substrate-binding protein
MHRRRSFLRHGAGLFFASLAGRAWTQAPLRIALGEPAYLPLYDPGGHDGEGVFIDVFRELLARRMGVALAFGMFPWARAQVLVEAGQQDAICTLPTPARREYAVCSREAVVSLPNRLFVHADNPLLPRLRDVHSVEALRGIHPLVLGYIGNDWARQTFAGMRVDMSGDFDSAVRKLAAGRGDVMIDDAYSVRRALDKLEGGGRVLMLDTNFAMTDYHLLIGKRSPYAGIMDAFDGHLSRFRKEEQYRRILQRYGVAL